MHKNGELKLPTGDSLTLDKILFDSGALHSSYISKELVDQNRNELTPFLVPSPGLGRLGDNKTMANVKESLVIPVAFYHEGKRCSAHVVACGHATYTDC